MNPTVSDIVLIGPVRTGKHFDLLTRFLRHHTHCSLAKFTLYIQGKFGHFLYSAE